MLDRGSTGTQIVLGAVPLGPLKEMLTVPERAFVVRALEHCRGSRQEAARLLGISRTTLFHKMRKYDLLAPGDATEDAAGRPESIQRPA